MPPEGISSVSLNDSERKSVLHALRGRIEELDKLAKKANDLDRPAEAAAIKAEADYIREKITPRFSDQGHLNFDDTPMAGVAYTVVDEPPPGKKGKGKKGKGAMKLLPSGPVEVGAP